MINKGLTNQTRYLSHSVLFSFSAALLIKYNLALLRFGHNFLNILPHPC